MTEYSFVHASRSLIDETDSVAHLARLAADGVERNQACGITGALIYSFGQFAQVVEGPKAEIDRTIRAFLADTQVTDFVSLQYAPIETRRFDRWSLAYAGSSLYVQRCIAFSIAQAGQDWKPAVDELLSLLVELSLPSSPTMPKAAIGL